MGKESLQQFLGDWAVHPLHTFRQGFRRTWIVRSTQQPVEKTIFHDYGLAVIKEAAPRRPPQQTERYQVPRADRPVQFVKEQAANDPKSWAGIVSSNARPEIGPKRVGMDGTVSAMAASTAAVGVVGAAAAVQSQASAAIPRAPVLEQPQPVTGTQPAWNPASIMEMLGTAIEAALKPLRGQLEATIVPMQKTIESLQAEFVAIRELAAAGDDDMSDAAASEMALALRDPKRGTDTDRVQTRATRLRLTASGS